MLAFEVWVGELCSDLFWPRHVDLRLDPVAGRLGIAALDDLKELSGLFADVDYRGAPVLLMERLASVEIAFPAQRSSTLGVPSVFSVL